ncbi:hypothetical protein PYCCODRAFT_1460490 [Trametes coccinea BRFM310]|uniref:Uncharacterized protein n=1 Tax=Trametes coccinea (strain BRFM310) TaxID=1353009 RepID=A0A1Y2IFH4_TRAC3|nr:hypothetical protein PYCCODRAFT_1460490 [Trametes coccinea BRFM310]
MSSPTATVFIQAAHTAQAAIPAASPASTSPPIVELARVAGHAVSLSLSYLSRGLSVLARSLLVPLPLLYTPLLYLLGPVIAFAQVLLDIFVFAPYAIVAFVARNVYPIYVFVGAALICAALVGYLARMISVGLTYAIFAPRSPPPAFKHQETAREMPYLRDATPKTRMRKRVSIKEER